MLIFYSILVFTCFEKNIPFKKDITTANFFYLDKFVIIGTENSFYLCKYFIDQNKDDVQRFVIYEYLIILGQNGL